MLMEHAVNGGSRRVIKDRERTTWTLLGGIHARGLLARYETFGDSEPFDKVITSARRLSPVREAGFTVRWIGSVNTCDIYQDKSAPSLNPLAFNLEKCDELRAFDTHVFGSTTYNRHTGVRRLPGPGPGVHRNFFPDRAGVPLSNGLEIRSLFEHSLLCSTLHRCSQAELEAPIAGVAVCNSPAAQAAWL